MKNNLTNRSLKKKKRGYIKTDEAEGGLEAILPGSIDEESGTTVETDRQRFEIGEGAEKVAEEAQVKTKERLERVSLEKSFTYFCRIDDTQESKFRVLFPLFVDLKTGYHVGVSYKDYETWQQAKDFFLKNMESREKLTQNPLLEIKMSENEKIAFSDFNSFNPQVALSEQTHEIPALVEKYLFEREKVAGTSPSALTYQETIKERGWENKLYSFISSYLGEDGVETVKQLKIESLDNLTPRQAVELATQIVIDLTKYNNIEGPTGITGIITGSEKTKADQSSALQLLKEGRLR